MTSLSCPHCAGEGRLSLGHHWIRCPLCFGSGAQLTPRPLPVIKSPVTVPPMRYADRPGYSAAGFQIGDGTFVSVKGERALDYARLLVEAYQALLQPPKKEDEDGA